MSFIQFYGNNTIVDGKVVIGRDTYGLFYNTENNGIYKANLEKTMNLNKTYLMPLSLILIPIMTYFPNDFLPFNNLFLFLLINLLSSILIGYIGYRFSQLPHEELIRITLTEEDWQSYLKKGNQKYIGMIGLTTFIIFLWILSIGFSYTLQSKWLFFLGIGLSFITGSGITNLSKTRYLLYKNNITPDLTTGDNEDERITHW